MASNSVFFGQVPTFENTLTKPSAAAVFYWKWNSQWMLQLTDVELQQLVGRESVKHILDRYESNLVDPAPFGAAPNHTTTPST